MGKIIGVVAIKGGVGKTSVTISLGATLANEFNKKVLLVDANFSAPNLALYLGLVRPKRTLHHVLSNKLNIKNAIYTTDHGFYILPGALVYGKIDPFRLKKKIEFLRGYYDFILIDSSPSLNNEMLATMIASDELFVVTTPDHVTLSNTIHAVQVAKKKRVPISGLILNKVYNKRFELDLDEIEDATDCGVLAVLPHEVNVLEALSENIPSVLYKKSEGCVEYKKLCAALVGEKYYDDRWRTKIKNLFSKSIDKQEVNRTIFKDRIEEEINY